MFIILDSANSSSKTLFCMMTRFRILFFPELVMFRFPLQKGGKRWLQFKYLIIFVSSNFV